ncbi:hypothetical protein DL96DRAFT_1667326 [Flagelloscypha sp. PMI_526]|nr:hypothetical protein DL96DRAFT_1667326 [Flagelloscypha sp. PMI_526]
MQEAEEQDTCRICSAPAEPDQPLFHPCKCSGTIRYIHQDCLTTWLAHSKKKHCDVCKHPYSFTKVYAPNMPHRLPFFLILRRLVQSAFFAFLYGIRAVAVTVIWIAVLPLVTVWTWRMYFSMGDSTAWWIADRERPAHATVNPFYSSVPPPPATSEDATDILSGQIIASLIVLTFVAVFLLREWISQNARPGFFDEDPLPEELRGAPAPPPQPHVDVPPPLPEPVVFVPAPQAPLLPPDIVPPPRGRGRQPGWTGHEERGDAFGRRVHATRVAAARRRWEETDREDPFEEPQPIAPTAPLDSYPFTFRAELPSRRAASTEHLMTSSASSMSSPPAPSATASTSSLPAFPSVTLDAPRADLPFRLSPPASSSSTSPPPFQLQNPLVSVDTPSPNLLSQESNRSSSPPTYSLEAPNVPFQLSPPTTGVQPAAGSPPTPSSSQLRRPPLPGSAAGLPSNSPYTISPARTPLESPSVSTFRPPEDLGGGLPEGSYFADTTQTHPQLPVEDDDDELVHVDGAISSDESGSGELIDAVWEGLDVGVPEERRAEEMDHFFADPFEGNQHGDQNAEDREDGEDEHQDNAVPLGDLANMDEDQRAAADAAAIVDAQDDLEANAEDDMEGAMEAIGMRGPIYGVIQNATLMIFVLDTAMGLGVWIPYTIGKSTALLTLNPPRLLKILHLPIQAIRLVTDPIVDAVVFVISSFIMPPILRLAGYFLRGQAIVIITLVRYIFGQEKADAVVDFTQDTYVKAFNTSSQSFDTSFFWPATTAEMLPTNITQPSQLEQIFEPLIEKAEPMFANLGAHVRHGSVTFATWWSQLALGHGSPERVFALALGYTVICILIALYLNIITVGNMKTAGRAVRTVVRQQLLVLKVAMFIFIELVTFPLGCGIVLDLCTIWLFPEASLASRIAFFMRAPLTAMFYHWIAGTMFMYSFAILLSGCRGLLRPGAMWFIRDPQDQNAHPIRDILDRPTFTQFRKICISGLMYTVVVVCGVASIASLLFLGGRSILPLRWKNREPLSSVPVDLLFLHLVLPYSMHYFRPKTTIKALTTVLWKFLARKLRLTSYYFGERRREEEYTPKTWDQFFSLEDELPGPSDVRDGRFRRVPATDNLALPKDLRATAAVLENGDPEDNYAAGLIKKQNDEAIKAKRQIDQDYTIVYLPPRFAQRIMAFIAIMWIIGSILLGICIALPIQLGRSFFATLVSYPVHDGYSLIAGFYLLWGCYIVATAIEKLDKRRQRKRSVSVTGDRADLRFLVLKRGLIWIMKASYFLLTLGVIIPTLLGIVMDFYLVLPLRMKLDPNFVPTIRVVDAWALGLLYAKIGIQIFANGIMNLDPWLATKDYIAPFIFGFIGMIVGPAALYKAYIEVHSRIGTPMNFHFLSIYPVTFLCVAVSQSSKGLLALLGSWSQTVRDKEFLIEMRLRNHDPNDPDRSDTEEDRFDP